MPIVPVSLSDSEVPPPDESVGPIPGRRATLSSTVGPHSVIQWGHMHCVWGPIPGPTLLMPSYHTLEIHHTAILLFALDLLAPTATRKLNLLCYAAFSLRHSTGV